MLDVFILKYLYTSLSRLTAISFFLHIYHITLGLFARCKPQNLHFHKKDKMESLRHLDILINCQSKKNIFSNPEYFTLYLNYYFQYHVFRKIFRLNIPGIFLIKKQCLQEKMHLGLLRKRDLSQMDEKTWFTTFKKLKCKWNHD